MKKRLCGLAMVGFCALLFLFMGTTLAKDVADDVRSAEIPQENPDSVEYEVPDGVDLHRELWLIGKLRRWMGVYDVWGTTRVPDVARKAEGYVPFDRLMNGPEAMELWKERWNVELPEYVSIADRPPESRQYTQRPVLEGVMDPRMWLPDHGGNIITERENPGKFRIDRSPVSLQEERDPHRTFCVRNGNVCAGSVAFLVATYDWPEEERAAETCGPCRLEYLFLGTCVTRDETGQRIALVRPTGWIFTFDNDEQNRLRSCVEMKDGRMTGHLLAWSSGKLVVDVRVVEDGSLPVGPDRAGVPYQTETNGKYAQTGAPYVESEEGKEGSEIRFTGEGFVTRNVSSPDGKNGILLGEVESRLLNPNDHWMPWSDTFGNPPYIFPTFYRIAYP